MNKIHLGIHIEIFSLILNLEVIQKARKTRKKVHM
jgi:hypothetical protein